MANPRRAPIIGKKKRERVSVSEGGGPIGSTMRNSQVVAVKMELGVGIMKENGPKQQQWAICWKENADQEKELI